MRSIKFRAWDGSRLRSWKDIVDTLGFHYWVIGGCNGVELMQYTGLKDKSGREIYEGDWIKGYLDMGGVDENYDFTDIVEFRNGCFQCYNKADFSLDTYDKLEVIGNIYENPELLKEK